MSDDPAIVHAGGVVSYAQLDTLSTRLAQKLIRVGVSSGRLVAVPASRSIEACVALVAALKAGAIYLPLDTTLPGDYLSQMLAGLDVAVMVRWPDVEPRDLPVAICEFDLGELAEAEMPSPPSAPVSGTDIGCVMFTSGSTGVPKASTNSLTPAPRR